MNTELVWKVEIVETDAKHNWYFVSAIYSCDISNVKTNTTERLVFLVLADKIETARQLGHEIALNKEHGYKNQYDECVAWKFDQIDDVQALFDHEIVTGTDVFWSFSSPPE